ncbi:MAG: CDP-alcohol phosphatidyltransferase family protein [Kofleriaceae bacterium]
MSWAEIDARRRGPVDATTEVGGLPLVSRLVRQLARQGYAGAQVRCADDDGRARVCRALDARPGPGSFPVEVVVGSDAGVHPPTVALDGCALYHADALAAARRDGGPVNPAFVVRTLADRAAGVHRLFGLLGKSLEREGAFSYYVARPLSRHLARRLLPTTISPNQVTLAAIACGIAAAVLLARGGGGGAAVAGALLVVGALLDNVDGDLARLRLQFSRTGEWLDAIGDEVVTLSVTGAIGLGLAHDGAAPTWRTVSLAAAALGAVVLVQLYVELARRGGAIDTAVYPWFFKPPPGTAPRPPARRGRLGRAVAGALDLVIRRDVYITVVAGLLVIDQRPAALVLLLAGVVGLAVTYLLHQVVVRCRRG